MFLLMLGCGPPPEVAPSCDPRTMSAGEVRARRLPCSSELLPDGDNRRGDWVLENSLARFVVRDAPDALTRLEIAGGTLIDAAGVGGSDPLIEAVPLIGTGWLLEAEITTWSEAGVAGLEIVGRRQDDGDSAIIRYALSADSPTLYIEGIDGLSVTPRPGVERVGPVLERDSGDLLGIDGQAEDAGGTIVFEAATSVTIGDRQTVHAALWPDGSETSGAASGTWVEALRDGTPLARYPITGGRYSGRLPPDASSVRAVQAGAEDGPEVLPGEESAVGAEGRVRLRVTNGTSRPRPATLYWAGVPYPTLPGESALTGPGSGTATVFAGPGFELAEVALNISAETDLSVHLPWVVTPAVLADLALITAPDNTERRGDDEILDEAAAAGVSFALLIARDEVSSANPNTSDHVFARTGSQSAGVGTPIAWPWSPSINKPAHSAAPWAGRSAADLLALMARRDNRTTIVTPEWIEAAGDPSDWIPMPDLIRVNGPEDVALLASLYDDWLALPPVGPLTWVEGLDQYAEVDVEAMLLEGRTIATNGPRIVLTADNEGPGSILESEDPITLSLRVEAPSWIPLSGAALIGPGGEALGTWSLSGTAPVRLTRQYTLDDPPDWILAVCWGEDAHEPFLPEPAWAISAPIWMGRP